MEKKKVLIFIGVLAVIGLAYYGYNVYQTTSGSSEKNSRRIRIKRNRITDDTTEEEI
jgi:hypothetical protein